MALALSIFVFLTIVVIVFAFGAATVAPSSVLGSRLREIGWQRPKAPAKPAMRERMQLSLIHIYPPARGSRGEHARLRGRRHRSRNHHTRHQHA